MAKDATTTKAEAPAKTEAPKRERKVLTDEERIAKIEAELKAAREKAEAKKNKARNAAVEQVNKLIAKRDELNAKIDALIEEHQLDGSQPVSETKDAEV